MFTGTLLVRYEQTVRERLPRPWLQSMYSYLYLGGLSAALSTKQQLAGPLHESPLHRNRTVRS